MYHGLVSLGHNVVDYNDLWYMRRGLTDTDRTKLYGSGFTLYGTLPSMEVDRTGIRAKVRLRYFDVVVYGSCWRCLDLFNDVSGSYPANKIILLDGEDHQWIHRLANRGVYFKRELVGDELAFPIGLSIPRDRFTSIPTVKSRLLAALIPGDRSTYVYSNEREYRDAYARSFFARTTKKAGWDCLRHCEIIAAGCLPLFDGLEGCPARTMTFTPKKLLSSVNAIASCLSSVADVDLGWYFETRSEVRKHALMYLTTEAMAKYVLTTVGVK